MVMRQTITIVGQVEEEKVDNEGNGDSVDIQMISVN